MKVYLVKHIKQRHYPQVEDLAPDYTQRMEDYLVKHINQWHNAQVEDSSTWLHTMDKRLREKAHTSITKYQDWGFRTWLHTMDERLPGEAHKSMTHSPGWGSSTWLHTMDGRFWAKTISGKTSSKLGASYRGLTIFIPTPLQNINSFIRINELLKQQKIVWPIGNMKLIIGDIHV